jgi:hypothetical protein
MTTAAQNTGRFVHLDARPNALKRRWNLLQRSQADGNERVTPPHRH